MSYLSFEDDDDRGSPVCWCGGCADDPCSIVDHADKAYSYGAAAAFGIVGMFEALRQNPRTPLVVERSYWTSEIDGRRLYDCFCPGCGTQMKGRRAGVDEGTSNEWCGVCRYGE